MHAPRRPLRDPKTALQEWAQARGKPTPVYREVARSGPPHAPVFVIAVEIEDMDGAEATGRFQAHRGTISRTGVSHP